MYGNEPIALSGAEQCKQAERTPETMQAMERLNSALLDTPGIAERLAERLVSVLRPSTPATGGENGKIERGYQATLPQAIQNQTDRALRVNAMLADIINRLEV